MDKPNIENTVLILIHVNRPQMSEVCNVRDMKKVGGPIKD
jgi:hypothetical protein